MKRRVGRNGTTNSMTNNPSIVHGAVGDEIIQLKWLSFKPTIVVDNANYFNMIDKDDERQKDLRSQSKLKKEALPVVNDKQLPVEKQKTLKMDTVQREYERCLTTLQQNSGGYIGDEEDYNDHTKSKLNPFVSRDRASRNNDDRQQPITYVEGETYKHSHVLSDIFRPLQLVKEEIEKYKTTDDKISLTRDMLRNNRL